MSGFRKHGRKLVKCVVTLVHREIGEVITETRDISETGVFLNCRDLIHLISVGDSFNARLYTDVECVSETSMTVVRLSDEGIGLEFD